MKYYVVFVDARNKTFIECLQEPVFSEKDRKDEINTYSVGVGSTIFC